LRTACDAAGGGGCGGGGHRCELGKRARLEVAADEEQIHLRPMHALRVGDGGVDRVELAVAAALDGDEHCARSVLLKQQRAGTGMRTRVTVEV